MATRSDDVMTTYGTVSAKQPAWQKLSDPLQLLINTSVTVGKDIAILGVIIWKVYFREMYQQPCKEDLGLPLAVGCEYTKAYMRSLPLMGIVILIVVASRQILYQRIYYQMLLHNTLLRFESPSPLSDPIFKLLLWCIANAFCHFAPLVPAVRWWVGESSVEEEKVKEGQEVLIFYCGPVAVFTWLLWNSYNIHSRLIPLSSYMEGDPVGARRALTKLSVLDESVIFEALNRGCMKSDAILCSMKDAIAEIKEHELEFAEFSDEEEDSRGSSPIGTNEPTTHGTRSHAHLIDANSEQAARSRAHLSDTDSDLYDFVRRDGSPFQWRLDSKLWPARLLLSRRLQDEDSIHFMHMWCNFVLVALSMQFCVFFILVCQIIEDFMDVNEGQRIHLIGMMVQFAHLMVTMWLSFVFVRNAFTSINHATHRLDLLCCRRYHVDITVLCVSVVAIPVAMGLFLTVIAVRVVYPFGAKPFSSVA